MLYPDFATSQPPPPTHTPCVVSFKDETSVGQAVPLRGMFTAILQMRKLVGDRMMQRTPFLPSLYCTSASTHGCLIKGRVTTSECNSKPQWYITSSQGPNGSFGYSFQNTAKQTLWNNHLYKLKWWGKVNVNIPMWSSLMYWFMIALMS